MLLQLWAEILPGGVATQVGHNSEAYLAALVLAAWIQYVRPRLTGAPREWPATAVVSVALIAIGLGLLASDWPSRFRTLNETCFALALLLPYVQLRRRPSRSVAVAIAVIILVIVLTTQSTQLGTDLAETYGMIMLAPLALDVVDRGILDPDATTSPPARFTWYAAMVITPVVMSVLEYKVEVGGLVGEFTRYGVRIHEAFIAMLLLGLYFAVALGRTGRAAETTIGPSREASLTR